MTHQITLTEGQKNAVKAFHMFMWDPDEPIFILEGYSGTGKSTVIKEMITSLPDIRNWAEYTNPEVNGYEIILTATTNKAADTFSSMIQKPVKTIHSFLGLLVRTDYKTGVTTLVPKNDMVYENCLLFIDEASFIDPKLLGLIFTKIQNSKVVFIGDPNQLIQVKARNAPVFELKCPKARLTKVVRQAEGNPIIDLSAKFCETVSTGKFFSFKPDGHHIVQLTREEFDAKILSEFCRDSWRFNDSKILAWTNKRAIAYNNMVINNVTGDPKIYAGDYVICNSYFSNGSRSIKTDEMVLISDVEDEVIDCGVKGSRYLINGSYWVFMPNHLEDKKKRINLAKSEEDFDTVGYIDQNWIDLRAMYASTIAKSQGSTYDKVFIDLDDIAKCNSGDAIARMLYVGVSRARHHVYLTGDFC